MITKESITEKLNSFEDLTIKEMITLKEIMNDDPTFEDNFEEYQVFDILTGLEILKSRYTLKEWNNYLTENLKIEDYEMAAEIRDIITIL